MAEEMQTVSGGNVEIRRANPLKNWFSLIVVVVCAIVAFAVFYLLFGDPSNFKDGEKNAQAYQEWVKAGADGEAPPTGTSGEPLNFMGITYKGGFVIPIGMTLLLIVFVFSIERFISLFFVASGKGSVDVFVQKVKLLLQDQDIDGAMAACDKQKGSVASVVKAGLRKYKELETVQGVTKDQKKASLQQAIDEATAIELPELERNLSVLSTIVSLGVLVGLFGTVLGMIRAFSALGAEGGSPDATALSIGISEALVNTAFGIFNSATSVIFYNIFNGKITSSVNRIEEVGYAVVQAYDNNHAN